MVEEIQAVQAPLSSCQTYASAADADSWDTSCHDEKAKDVSPAVGMDRVASRKERDLLRPQKVSLTIASHL